ncbi:DEAD/DEAH box helicase [Saccharopolyspora erythraea]|uniref:DEAD/DEAH box helicase n=1 Tax=Saccharopolyspora erythraea TaxID=1836 RepID=UPI001BA87CB8|nr:DEAD/DEAH box helicase [Saccharopolyspora erythraea]
MAAADGRALAIGEAVEALRVVGGPWAAAAVLALRLVASGQVVPGVSSGGFDQWTVGPLEPDDVVRVQRLAAAIPAGEEQVRAFLDAVADWLPRTPDGDAFGGMEPRPVSGLPISGVRVSLRMEVEDDGGARAVVQVHSLADPALVADAAEVWRGAPAFGADAHAETVIALRRAAQVWAPLRHLLDAEVPDELAPDDDDLKDLLRNAGRLADAGVHVHWPKHLVRDLTAQAHIRPVRATSTVDTDLLWFEWRVALGGDPLTAAEMDELARAHRPIVRLRGRWTLVDPALARKAWKRELKPVTTAAALGAALAGETVGGERVPVTAEGGLADLRERLAGKPEVFPQPDGLAATLRDYQLQGLSWLARIAGLGLGGCLADDMGLGKTVTLIALHLHRRSGPTLVVCPASLLGNWEREIRRFAPGVPVRRFHGARRSLDDAEGFVLTTYGTVRTDAEALNTVHWGLVVADEAQHVKNHRSSTAKALRTIHGRARVALTGTPVENDLAELWAILDWAAPGLLGSLAGFRSRWAKPIERDAGRARGLAALLRPFLLRRSKSDPGIAPELPAKTETDRPVPLTREQAGLYAAVVRETMAEIAESTDVARRGLVVKLLTSLKQICNHPAHYLGEGAGNLTGRSGKLELLDELLDTILAEGGSVLVFTQYVAMAELLEAHLRGRGISTRFLHGGTPVPQRDAMVRDFQEGVAPVFLLSLKAAGTGLNLTRADHVVHYDRWWNPAVEAQATDRAHRIGQTRPVQVHRLVAEGTVEDRIAEVLRAKRSLADSVLGDGGPAGLTELSDAELAELVELRGE